MFRFSSLQVILNLTVPIPFPSRLFESYCSDLLPFRLFSPPFQVIFSSLPSYTESYCSDLLPFRLFSPPFQVIFSFPSRLFESYCSDLLPFRLFSPPFQVIFSSLPSYFKSYCSDLLPFRLFSPPFQVIFAPFQVTLNLTVQICFPPGYFRLPSRLLCTLLLRFASLFHIEQI
jgi:hypothetical protein